MLLKSHAKRVHGLQLDWRSALACCGIPDVLSEWGVINLHGENFDIKRSNLGDMGSLGSLVGLRRQTPVGGHQKKKYACAVQMVKKARWHEHKRGVLVMRICFLGRRLHRLPSDSGESQPRSLVGQTPDILLMGDSVW
jgi:hypothetical protein